MFGPKRSPYKVGDVVHFVCPPRGGTLAGDVIAVEKDGSLGISTHRNPGNHIVIDPKRIVAAFRKGFPL